MKLMPSLPMHILRPLLAVTAVAGLSLTASAAGFIKFDGIDGEATDHAHKDWINLVSVGSAMARPLVTDPATGQRRRGDVMFEDIVCVLELDKSSPKLMEAVCTGALIPSVVIELTRPVGDATGMIREVPYLQYEMKNVIITSYSLGAFHKSQLPVGNLGSSGSDGVSVAPQLPVSNLSLNFEEIKVTYFEVDDTGASGGSVDYQWKVEQGEK